jgi:hypothetical protein
MRTFPRKPGYLNRQSAAALLAAKEAQITEPAKDGVAPRTTIRKPFVEQSPTGPPAHAQAMPQGVALIIARLDDDRLYTTKELARVLGFISHRTLERYRCSTGKGGGPAYMSSGGPAFAKGKVVYLGLDVKVWLMSGYVASWHNPDHGQR